MSWCVWLSCVLLAGSAAGTVGKPAVDGKGTASWLRRAEVLLEAGNASGALSALQRVERKVPPGDPLFRSVQVAAVTARTWGKPLSSARRACAAPGLRRMRDVVFACRGRVALVRGQWSGARNALQRALALRDGADVRVWLGQAAAAVGAWDRARRHFARANVPGPHRFVALVGLAHVAAAAEDPTAWKWMQAAYAEESRSLGAALLVARWHPVPEEAVAVLEKNLSLYPEHPGTHALMAYRLAQLGDPERSDRARALLAALGSEVSDRARGWRVLAWLELGEVGKAVAAARELPAEGGDPIAAAARVRVAVALGRPGAIGRIADRLSRRSGSLEVRVALMAAYVAQGRLSRAHDEAERAAKRYPQSWQPYAVILQVACKRGLRAVARRAWAQIEQRLGGSQMLQRLRSREGTCLDEG